MSGQQQIVAAGGAGLLLLNFWTGPDRATINAGLFDSHATPDAQNAAHKTLVRFAATAVALAAGVLLSGASSQWGSAMVAILVALFILWTMNHYGAGAPAAAGGGGRRNASRN